MSEAEIRDRLIEIAQQESNHSAAIQAMRLLREMDEAASDGEESGGELYEGRFGIRQKGAASAA